MRFESYTQVLAPLACTWIAFELVRWACKWLWLRAKYDLHKIPGPSELTMAGNLRMLAGAPAPRAADINRWGVKFGKVYQMNMLGQTSVVVNDPKFAQENIYCKAEHDLPKSDVFEKLFGKMLSPYGEHAIFTMKKPDAKYRSYRKTLACAFSTTALKKAYPDLWAKAEQFARKVGGLTADGASFDIQDKAVLWSFDSIGRFAYGLNFNAVEKESHPLLDAMLGTSSMAMLSLSPFWKLFQMLAPFSATVKKYRRAQETLYREYDKVLDALDLYGDPPADDDESLRAQLMRLRDPFRNNERATEKETYAEMAQFLIGGTDSTSHQLSWIMMCLATHLDVQDRVYEELKKHGLTGEGAGRPEFPTLASLHYLNCVLKEGLRLVSSAPGGSIRVLQADTNVLGYRVPRGTWILSERHTLNKCPWMWENGDVFDPDRFSSQGTPTPDSEPRIWTFGMGARACAGQRFAVFNLRMMLVVLLSKYRFTLDPRVGGFQGALDRSAFTSTVLSCEGGVWLRATPRE